MDETCDDLLHYGETVKFSLTYDGELLSASDKHSRVRNKNHIRFSLSEQLDALLISGDFQGFQVDEQVRPDAPFPTFHGIEFLPVVTRAMNASCALTIRLMQSAHQGRIVHGGDMDNRIKTLFDALRTPENGNEVIPSEFGDRKLCVCLLEDDSLITDLHVSTVQLLTSMPRNHVRLVIDVELKPFDFFR